jgi:hypothetical protein
MIESRVMPGRLDTRTAPACAATTASTIASPRPVDDGSPACDRAVSALVNRSNRSGSRSGGIPGPSSVTVSAMYGSAGTTPRRTEATAAGAASPALAQAAGWLAAGFSSPLSR